jgi:hypothetical protein
MHLEDKIPPSERAMKDRTILHWNLIFVTWYQSQLFWSRPLFFSSVYRLNSSVFGDFFWVPRMSREAFLTQFNGKNYASWDFQFHMFVKGKEL